MRAASSDAETFCAELALLVDILARLKGNFDNGTLPPSRFGDDSFLVVSLPACKNQLKVMRAKFGEYDGEAGKGVDVAFQEGGVCGKSGSGQESCAVAAFWVVSHRVVGPQSYAAE